jgi:hypothetical protein
MSIAFALFKNRTLRPTIQRDSPRSAQTLLENGAGKRREKKRQLLERVRDWVDREPELARGEFELSAAEVITLLRTVEASLFGAS